MAKCSGCGGFGELMCDVCYGTGTKNGTDCTHCNGGRKKCTMCNGSGDDGK